MTSVTDLIITGRVIVSPRLYAESGCFVINISAEAKEVRNITKNRHISTLFILYYAKQRFVYKYLENLEDMFKNIGLLGEL